MHLLRPQAQPEMQGDITPGLVGKVKQLTGYPLAGFSGAYDNKGDALIPVPLTPGRAALAERGCCHQENLA